MSAADVKAVEGILGRNYDNSTDLKFFIKMATSVVSRVVTCATRKSITLTDDEQSQLTHLLAAHFYGSADQFYRARRTGRASGEFMGETKMGLDGSLYGQNAKLLDPSGCLAAMDKGAVIQFEWLGKPPSEQIPYWERD